MATILPTYDWTRPSAHIEKARSRTYPWDEWLDGQIRKLERGEDFDGPAMSVERVIRTSANRRDIRVRIRVEGDSIYLQAHLGDARTARGVTKSATKKAVKEARAAKAEGRGNGVAASDVIKTKHRKAEKTEPAEAPVKTAAAKSIKASQPMPKPAKPSTNGNGHNKVVAPAGPPDPIATVARTIRKLVRS